MLDEACVSSYLEGGSFSRRIAYGAGYDLEYYFKMASNGKPVVWNVIRPKQIRLPFKKASNKGWEALNHIADML